MILYIVALKTVIKAALTVKKQKSKHNYLAVVSFYYDKFEKCSVYHRHEVAILS